MGRALQGLHRACRYVGPTGLTSLPPPLPPPVGRALMFRFPPSTPTLQYVVDFLKVRMCIQQRFLLISEAASLTLVDAAAAAARLAGSASPNLVQGTAHPAHSAGAPVVRVPKLHLL